MVASLQAAIPIPIPIFGGAPKGLSELQTKDLHTMSNAKVTMAMIQIFLLFITLVIVGLGVFWLLRFLCLSRLKKLACLLSRLKMESVLRTSGSKLTDEKNIARQESLKETVYFIDEMVRKKFFLKKVGENFQKRIIESLQAISQNKIDFDKQKALIDSWLEMLKGL